MHKTLSFLALLLLIGTGCFPSSEETLSNDFTPVHGKASASTDDEASPWDRRMMTAISYDGITFTQNDQWICDQCAVPDAVIKDGSIYVYYTGLTLGDRVNTTAVAVSQDIGRTWTYHYVELVGNTISERFFDPDVVLLEDGTFRLFFTGGQPKSIHYAESADGITFTYKGVLFSQPDDTAQNSTTIHIGETWHMYAQSKDGISRLWHLTGTDALTFTVYDLTSFPNDGVLSSPSNGFWKDDRFTLFMSDQKSGSIGSMWSKNGFDWYPTGQTNLEPTQDEASVEDPAVVDLGDGRYLMFYVTNIE